MISELKVAGHTLSDEQQVQAVIRSLPHNWEHMKVNLTHNENVKTFEDTMRHLELEEDRLLANKVQTDVYFAGSGSHGASGSKRKHFGGFKKGKGKGAGPSDKKPKFEKHGKGKRPFKKNIFRMKCYNCDKKGHFARDCNEPKNVEIIKTLESISYVSSSIFLTTSHPLWTINSGATDHVARDRYTFVEFRRIPRGARWIYVGNNSRVEVKGVGTC